MSPATMNPGFILPNDLIDFDRPLDNALIDLMVRRYPMLISRESVRRKQPGREDKIRIALVDPDGEEDLPTWIRRLSVRRAYLWRQHSQNRALLCEPPVVVRSKRAGQNQKPSQAGDLLREADIAFAGIKCKPNFRWLLSSTRKNPSRRRKERQS